MSRFLTILQFAFAALALAICQTEPQKATAVDPGQLRALTTITASPAQSGQKIPGGYLFLSSNTEENLTLEEASLRLASESQKRFRHVAGDILASIGLAQHQIQGGLGDWSDGVENSILVEVSGTPDLAALRYAAAWFGLLANQKSVLLFCAGAKGPDCVHELEVPEASTPQLRRVLDEHGIKFRTLIAVGKGHRVVVFDEGRQLHHNLVRLAAFYGVRLNQTHGTGAFLGEETRTAAQDAFRQAINEYEAKVQRPHYRPPASKVYGGVTCSPPLMVACAR
jgi:hypothetical protein